MTLSVSDPLALVAIESGLVQAPLRADAAAGDQPLDDSQRSAVLGEPIPIVFCRRDEANGSGGVLVSPAATEARFTNDADNAVTASYHLVVSEGRIGSIQVRDVLQGPCRRGTHTQTYDRRAGTWQPGNFIVDRNRPPRRFWTQQVITPTTQSQIDQFNLLGQATLTDPSELTTYPFNFYATWYEAVLVNPAAPDNHDSWQYVMPNGFTTTTVTYTKTIAATSYELPDATFYCGSIGTYTGLSTLSFTTTAADGSDAWQQQVHLFIRNGIEVPRLIEGTTGSSRNYADLVQWSLLNCANLPSSLIDSTALLAAANFLVANGLSCDMEIKDSGNLTDFLAQMAPYFLLADTRNNGQRGLRPLLPVNPDHTIKTTALTPVAVFTEEHIQPGSWEVQYVSLQDRSPVCVQVLWRQQPSDGVGIIRTSEVRYRDEAQDGPFEQHDLSAFCTRENHAVKVGAYIRARRRHVTHTARLQLRSLTTSLVPGDLVRVTLQRSAEGMNASAHNSLYEVASISQSVSGEVALDLTHCPVDSQGRSLVALDVAAATGSGIILPSNRSGVSCDVNSAGDTTVPAEAGLTGTPLDQQWVMGPPVPWEEVPPVELFNADEHAGLYFHAVYWSGMQLVVELRVSPTGRAAAPGFGPLEATITGESVAYDENNDLIVPQPENLPTLNQTVEIVREWSTYDDFSTMPVPPSNRIFGLEMRVNFSPSDLPPAGTKYRMTIEVTSTSGGFKTLEILNTAYAWFDWFIPSSADIPLGSAPGISYSQSSVLPGLEAASEAEMQNGTFKSTLQTVTGISAGEHWIRMDLGSVREVVGIVVGAFHPNNLWDPLFPELDQEQFDESLFMGYEPIGLVVRPFLYETVLQSSNDGITWSKVCPVLGQDQTGQYRWPYRNGTPGDDWPVLHEYTTGGSPLPDKELLEYGRNFIVDSQWPTRYMQDLSFAPRIPVGLRARYIRIYLPPYSGPEVFPFTLQNLSVTEFYVKVRSA